MKHIFIYLFAFSLPLFCSAQETVVIKSKLPSGVKERITVLKSDNSIREGLYQALIDNKTALAIGRYSNNKKTGYWNFYDTANHLLQRYNYTTQTLTYEAPEDSTSNCKYIVDKLLTDTDHTTKPVIIGDRFYGFLNYAGLFRLPKDMQGIDNEAVIVTMELLVSPGGRLADYVVHFRAPVNNYDRKVRLNIDLLSEEDKTFIPATVNGQPIACQIFIRCFLDVRGELNLY
ncbi:toxin-antitoxin system YwqK family antitoxin [Mucilaginibacter agri]|uniref:Uncharacterized protein n=1 Tax=Mucilaginibacter agri TaxID=2695265 RepID=A0A965ZH51_9SPHI|nr:hypothetical protein [Mucilaginibacter agri]NCD69899.1 hypothetical protein [Mucilaginibacter agri]